MTAACRILPLLAMCLTAFARPFVAQTPAAPRDDADGELLQEFFLGETVYPQHRHELQVTIGSAWRRSGGRSAMNLPVIVEFGLSNRLQLSTELSLAAVPGPDAPGGLAELETAVLYAIRPDVRRLAVSAGLEFSIPVVDEGDEDEELAWRPFVIAAQSVGRAQIHAGLRPRTRQQAVVNVAAVYPIGAWRATLEAAGTFGRGGSLLAAPGLLWASPVGLEIGVGVPVRVGGNVAERGLVFLLTYEAEF